MKHILRDLTGGTARGGGAITNEFVASTCLHFVNNTPFPGRGGLRRHPLPPSLPPPQRKT